MKKEITALIRKSERSMRAARNLFRSKDYDFAVSRAYYAVFYVSEALLLKKNLSYSKHSAVISGIHSAYVAGGELPKEFHRILNEAFDLRQEGDYLYYESITEEIAKKMLDDVEKQMKIGIEALKKP